MQLVLLLLLPLLLALGGRARDGRKEAKQPTQIILT